MARAARDEAERFVDNIREGGSTNIDAALKTALGDDPGRRRGRATSSSSPTACPRPARPASCRSPSNCRQANERRARVFCFGVGYDVNARLLDRLSGGNSGTSEYVKPDEDIETHVGRFYSKMTSPVLADIRIELAGIDVNRTYPRDLPDLFEGGQIVVGRPLSAVGQDHDPDRGQGRRRAPHASSSPPSWPGSTGDGSYDFVERLWAVRRVGDLIDQIDLHGQNKELVDELVALSTKYGILTPYTSFLADERRPACTPQWSNAAIGLGDRSSAPRAR